MSFPEKLTATLSGATRRQLYDWRRKGILVPEVSAENPPLYSFRDVVALRTVAFLRARTSLQKLRKAFSMLKTFDFTEHPSTYRFGTDGKTIAAQDEDGNVVDLVNREGQLYLFTLEEVFRSFTNFRDEPVVDFEHPRPLLELNQHRLGGWPTIAGTRVPYDAVADLLQDGTYSVEDVRLFYPTVSPSAARDALSFAFDVEQHLRGAQ